MCIQKTEVQVKLSIGSCRRIICMGIMQCFYSDRLLSLKGIDYYFTWKPYRGVSRTEGRRRSHAAPLRFIFEKQIYVVENGTYFSEMNNL